MEHFWKGVLGALGTVGTYLSYLLGGWDAAISIMFVIMGIDYVTGVIAAFRGKSTKTEGGGFSSRAAFNGLTKKLMMLLIIMLAVALDRLMGTESVCRIAAIGFYVGNEGMSIVENAAVLGVPFPQALLRVLESLKNKDAEGGTQHKAG